MSNSMRSARFTPFHTKHTHREIIASFCIKCRDKSSSFGTSDLSRQIWRDSYIYRVNLSLIASFQLQLHQFHNNFIPRSVLKSTFIWKMSTYILKVCKNCSRFVIPIFFCLQLNYSMFFLTNNKIFHWKEVKKKINTIAIEVTERYDSTLSRTYVSCQVHHVEKSQNKHYCVRCCVERFDSQSFIWTSEFIKIIRKSIEIENR